MRRTSRLLAALIGIFTAAQLDCVQPQAAEAAGASDRQLCVTAAASAEAVLRLPANLLKAMTAVESGFWPWAVRARGKSHMMPSRAAAVQLVKDLRAQGVKDIMVGCLQIHLRHHPDAFASIEQALEPSANAAYAGKFLKSLARGASWWDAVGRYQGGKPAAREAYVQKVASAFRAGAVVPAGRPRTEPAKPAPAAIILADAPFQPPVDGVLDMTPFVNLDFGEPAATPVATVVAMGPHIF